MRDNIQRGVFDRHFTMFIDIDDTQRLFAETTREWILLEDLDFEIFLTPWGIEGHSRIYTYKGGLLLQRMTDGRFSKVRVLKLFKPQKRVKEGE